MDRSDGGCLLYYDDGRRTDRRGRGGRVVRAKRSPTRAPAIRDLSWSPPAYCGRSGGTAVQLVAHEHAHLPWPPPLRASRPRRGSSRTAVVSVAGSASHRAGGPTRTSQPPSVIGRWSREPSRRQLWLVARRPPAVACAPADVAVVERGRALVELQRHRVAEPAAGSCASAGAVAVATLQLHHLVAFGPRLRRVSSAR